MRAWASVLGAVTLSAGSPSARADDAKPDEARAKLPAFTLKGLEGGVTATKDLAGKVVVLTFWATWCAPCVQEIGFFDKLYREHKDQGFLVLAVATDGPETQSNVRATVRRKKWSVPVYVDDNGSVMSVINPRASVPYSVVVDRSGRIVQVHAGFASGDEATFKELFENLLREN